jgi:ring-1,2-phenylacetyl-CoA epoxidase subunit PaaC
MKDEKLYKYILEISDNTLVLGQRLGELCGHGPSLETDIACTNISLDLLGQTRSSFQYAAELLGEDKTEDDVAFLRLEREYKNVLLVEQPNKDFAYTIVRQYLFDVYHMMFIQRLSESSDETLKAIAKKSIKEVSYHLRFSGDWIKRLGDGTEESHKRMQDAFDYLWTYTDELFHMTDISTEMVEKGIGVDVSLLKEGYYLEVASLLKEATLSVPETKYFQKGGKLGTHTEHMGYLLSELQYLQRTYPNCKW